MSNQADHTIVRLRVPPELKEKIEKAAEENNRSQSAEMVSRLEESFECNQSKLPIELINAARESQNLLRKKIEENQDLLEKQVKTSNLLILKLAEKLSDEEPIKKKVLDMLKDK